MTFTRKQWMGVGLAGLALILVYWKRDMLASAIYKTLPPHAQKYFSSFAKADIDNGLPPGMTGKIAKIESDFNPDAYNKSGAVGMMQIIPEIHPGVNPAIPEQAIAYAGQYLRSLYNKFGDWNKAIAAYNWGQGNLQKAIDKNGANWFAALPDETKKYLVKYNSMTSFS